MQNPHAPSYKPNSPDFGPQPGESKDDGMFFANRKKRDNGMFYSADGAEKSTASQESVEAGTVDHPLDELTDLQRKEAYAQLSKVAAFSAAKAGAAGAAVGAAAGFLGGVRAAADTPESRGEKIEKAKQALERAKRSEAGQAVQSARETVGHIGRAGANAATAAKREIDKRASDAAFDELEKSAGFLSLPTKAGVGKAVLRGLGYGGAGVGAMGLAAGGVPGTPAMVDFQTGKQTPDSPLYKGDSGQDKQIARLEEAPNPVQEARLRKQQREWAANRMEDMAARSEHRSRGDARVSAMGIDLPMFGTKGEAIDKARRAEDIAASAERGRTESDYSMYPGAVGSLLGTAQGEYQRIFSGNKRPPIEESRKTQPRAAKPAASEPAKSPASGQLAGRGPTPEQARDAALRLGPEGVGTTKAPMTAEEAAMAELRGGTGVRGGADKFTQGGAKIAPEYGPPPEGMGPDLKIRSAAGEKDFTIEDEASAVAKKPAKAPKKELAKAPEPKRGKPMSLGGGPAEIADAGPDVSRTVQRQAAAQPAPIETGRGGGAGGGPAELGALAQRGGGAPDVGAKADTDQLALAETRWGDEIDAQYPGLDPETRKHLLAAVAAQGGLPKDIAAGAQPGTAIAGNARGPSYDEMNPIADLLGPGAMVAGR